MNSFHKITNKLVTSNRSKDIRGCIAASACYATIGLSTCCFYIGFAGVPNLSSHVFSSPLYVCSVVHIGP